MDKIEATGAMGTRLEAAMWRTERRIWQQNPSIGDRASNHGHVVTERRPGVVVAVNPSGDTLTILAPTPFH